MASYFLSTNPTIANFSAQGNAVDTFFVDTGVQSSALSIIQNGANVQITDGTHTATLLNFSVSQINSEEFQNNQNPSEIIFGNNFDENSFTGPGAKYTPGLGLSSTDSDGNPITGSASGDYLSGLGGNDSIDGGGGNDLIFGGSGNDKLGAFDGNSTIHGGLGNDAIAVDGSGNYLVLGEGGDDVITGNTGGTNGNPGTGPLNGNSIIAGGDGNDILNFGASTGNLRLFGDAAIGNSNSINDGNDQITGGSGNDAIYGGGGSDVINGGTGNNFIEGNSGDDKLSAGNGNSTIFGGQGDDVITIPVTAGVAGVNGGAATPSTGDKFLSGDLGNDSIDASNSSGNNTIFGDIGNSNEAGDGNDTILGGTGKDKIYGGGGNDTITVSSANTVGSFLSGNQGNDILSGGAGNDSMLGGQGNDVLFGGAGADALEGDKGNNYYEYSSLANFGSESGNMTATADTIATFVSGQDHIVVGSTAAGATPATTAGGVTGPGTPGNNGPVGTAGSFTSYKDASVTTVEQAAASALLNDKSTTTVPGTGDHTYTFIAGLTNGYLVVDANANSPTTPNTNYAASGVITFAGDNHTSDLSYRDIIGALPTTPL